MFKDSFKKILEIREDQTLKVLFDFSYWVGETFTSLLIAMY